MVEASGIQRLIPVKGLVLAPMSGVTDPPFRLLAREKGADLAYTEMVSADGLVRGNEACCSLLRSHPAEGPLMVQIFGSDPVVMAEAASFVQEMGFAGVDINAGCPAAKVVRKGAGAALLRRPQLLKEILKGVRRALHIPMGIKVRSGWDQSNVNLLEICEMAVDCGVDVIAIHPRLRSQGFNGAAEWELIREAKRKVGGVIIGNGDIRSPLDVVRMLNETGCDGVMIGRGSWGNPWIFAQAKGLITHGFPPPPPSWEERKGLLLRHLFMHVAWRGAAKGFPSFIKHLGWYLKGYPGVAGFRRRMNAISSWGEYLREIKDYFRLIEADEDPRRMDYAQGLHTP